VTVTINGTNDVPAIGGVGTVVAVTDNLATSGALTIVDPDLCQSSFVAQTSTAGSEDTGAPFLLGPFIRGGAGVSSDEAGESSTVPHRVDTPEERMAEAALLVQGVLL
jgi:hypothetical protein